MIGFRRQKKTVIQRQFGKAGFTRMKRKISIIAVMVMLFVAASFGQTNKGGISGTVTDEKGAAVPGATVTITNVGTNQKTTLTTSDDGVFSANSLDPVLYNVVVESSGFKRALIQNVKVDTASIATINVLLEVGTVAEQVSIVAEGQAINSDSGTISQTITERQLRDLPLNNRSVLDLAMTMPNVAGDAGSEDVDANSTQPVPGFNLSVNGGRPGSTAILADGVNNTGIGIARAVVSFTPETVQEFTVQSSAYSAEFGTTGGGVINVTTKAGTNDFHGSVLLYHRNPKFNARRWSQGTAPRTPNNLRYTQGSASIGGPVFLPSFGEGGPMIYNGRNRTFFFFAYEPRWRTDFVTANGLVPTAAEQSGDFRGLVRTNSGFLPAAIAAQFASQTTNATSIGPAAIFQQFNLRPNGTLAPIATPATGQRFCQFGETPTNANGTCSAAVAINDNLNVIPQAFFDPAGVKLMEFMPEPGEYFLDNGFVRNYILERAVQQNETRYTLRLDHQITDNMKANFRYSSTPAVGIRSAGNDVNGNSGVYSDAKQYLLSFQNIISSSMVNDLRLNYTRGNFSEDFSPEFSIKTGRSFSRELGLTALTPGGMPLFWLNQEVGYSNADLGSGGSSNNFNVEQRFNINDIFYLNKGNMTWKFGVDLSDARLNVVPFFAASGGRWQFRVLQTSSNRGNALSQGGNNLASLLIGTPNAQDYRPILLSYYYQWLSGAAFVQNDWKVRPNLTLNLGLRYSLQLPRTEKNNLQGVLRPDITQTVNLTDAQRRAIATASGVLAADPIPSFVPTTAVIPAFAFAGRGGRSRYLTPIDKKGWEPRFGFAWSPKMKIFGLDTEDYSVVLRGGFGVSHAPINGNNRLANPDFGGFQTANTTNTGGSSGTADPTSPVRLTGNNAVQGSSNTSLDALLGTDANGLVFSKSRVIPSFAVNPNSGKVPYSQNWNLAMQFQLMRGTTVELAYVGNRGVHLYLPQTNLNLRDSEVISFLESNNVNAAGNVTDPLGRLPLLGGTTAITVPLASIYTPYLGFDQLNQFFDPRGSSIRHAGYIDVRRRIRNGLNFTANYTFSKSLDNASDASPDVRVLTTGSVRGQIGLGGRLEDEWAVSSFDVRHAFSATFTYDLPFGKGRQFLTNAPWFVNGIVGGWTMSGITRIQSGTPFQPFITDPNKLGSSDLNRTVRPDIVAGVPLKNPLWDPSCRVGAQCEPYVNPAAFMRPVKGELGNAPRTINLRAPFRKFFDFSIQKDFPLWGEGKGKLQLRLDLLNAFNHPIFQLNNLGNTPAGMGTFPVEITGENFNGVPQPITIAEYNTWATFWNTSNPNDQVPIQSTTAGAAINATLQTIRTNVNNVRETPRAGSTSGALPNNFFNIRLPEGFATRNSLSYDLRTLEGFKLWRIRNNYDPNFGTLFAPANGRYLQFGVKFIF
jgi:hypothetical protein